MQSEFGGAVTAALADEKKTQTWLANKVQITQGALNHLINKGYRPKRENLAPICHAFDYATGLDILCSHLRDEIVAAGYRRTEIGLSTHPAEVDNALQHALDDLRTIAGQRRDVAQLLLQLAALCEELPTSSVLSAIQQERLAAEAETETALPAEPKAPLKYPQTRRPKITQK